MRFRDESCYVEPRFLLGHRSYIPRWIHQEGEDLISVESFIVYNGCDEGVLSARFVGSTLRLRESNSAGDLTTERDDR